MTIFICQFCSRSIVNSGALTVHEKHCHSNPNYVIRNRSLKAGWQKGNPSPLRGRKFGRGKFWDIKYPLDEVCVRNSSYPRGCLKKRIIADDLLPYMCAICSTGPSWMGNPMPLILDHINGINNDNRLENLRFVCSNCDSQLDTYKSRNRKSKSEGEPDRRAGTDLKSVGT